MRIEKIVSGDIKIVYHDLVDTFGFYRIRQGKEPFICLSNELLLEDKEPLHLNVFKMLLQVHNSIPADSPYRLYPLRKYFEELIEDDTAPAAEQGPEIIIIGRAIRLWRFLPDDEQARVIGRLAG
jgi:hypothetical protein